MTKVEEKKKFVLQTEGGEEVNLADLMKEGIAEGIKEAGLPLDENGKFSMKSIPVDVKDEASRKEDAYVKSANFIKQLVLPEKVWGTYGVKAIDAGSGSFGSVIPTELYGEIITQSQRWTVIRNYAFVFQMAGKFLVPKEGTMVTAYWVTENAAVTESSPTTGNITLDDFGVACLIRISWKLLLTSPQNITQFVARLAGKAITNLEEVAFVVGDGTNKPKGITTETYTSIAQAGANLSYGDIMSLYYALPVGYRRNAQFITSAKGVRLLHSLADTAGRPLFPVGAPLDTFMGRPLIESEDIVANLGAGTNETFIIFGDLSNYWIKDGSSIEMATQDQIENLQTKVVVYKYVDGRVVNTDAFRKLTAVK